MRDARAAQGRAETLTRRGFLGGALTAGAALTATGALGREPRTARQRRWRTAFGLNGFMSSEREFGKTYPIWEVLEFAQREGFEGIELVGGWPQGDYPAPDAEARIRALRGLYRRYGLKVFSIQTSAGGAFRPDRAARERWLSGFRAQARFAHEVGCECIGLWPGGPLGEQSLDQAVDRLAETLREVGKIVSDEELLASVEIEPPFAFHRIEDLIRIVDGADHPQVKGMYDPSHFDLMNGGKGKPEELLERLGVHRVGYIHLTDTDGTMFGGTSRHLPCGDGHVDIRKSLEILWRGGFDGWIMIDPWKTEDPYDACRKGRVAIESARRELMRS